MCTCIHVGVAECVELCLPNLEGNETWLIGLATTMFTTTRALSVHIFVISSCGSGCKHSCCFPPAIDTVLVYKEERERGERERERGREREKEGDRERWAVTM